MNIGIIGNGFVGEAMAFAFSPSVETKVYDLDPLKSTNSLEETLDSNFVFICLPTPMKKDGSQDLSFIIDFFKNNKINHKDEISIKSLAEKNLVAKKYNKLKILGKGEIKEKIKITTDFISKSARSKIEKAGGLISMSKQKNI